MEEKLLEEKLRDTLNEKVLKLSEEKQQINNELSRFKHAIVKDENGKYNKTKEELEALRDLENVEKEIKEVEKEKKILNNYKAAKENEKSLLRAKEQIEKEIGKEQGKYEFKDGKMTKSKELENYEEEYNKIVEKLNNNSKKTEKLAKATNKMYEKYGIHKRVEKDIDKAWKEAIKENEQRDIDKAWEEALKENEQRDIDKAWAEAIKENEKRDIDKAWEEALKENEQRDIDKAWAEAIKENEQRDIDKAWKEAIRENRQRDINKYWEKIRKEREQEDINKAWDEAIKENEQRDIDKAWEEAIRENEQRDIDKKAQEMKDNIFNRFFNQNQSQEEPSDILDAEYEEIEKTEGNVSELDKADLKIKVDVRKNSVQVFMGNKKEKYNLKKTIKEMKKDYIKKYGRSGKKVFKRKGMEELIPTILKDVDQKYNTTRESNFKELVNDYYYDVEEEWGNLKIEFDLRNLYKIINPSVPTMSKGKLLDLAKQYESMDIANVKMGIRTETIDKIKTLGSKVKDFSQNLLSGGRKIRPLPEPKEIFEEVEENNMDKYKVDNKDNRIEENARQNMEQSEQNLEEIKEEYTK